MQTLKSQLRHANCRQIDEKLLLRQLFVIHLELILPFEIACRLQSLPFALVRPSGPPLHYYTRRSGGDITL